VEKWKGEKVKKWKGEKVKKWKGEKVKKWKSGKGGIRMIECLQCIRENDRMYIRLNDGEAPKGRNILAWGVNPRAIGAIQISPGRATHASQGQNLRGIMSPLQGWLGHRRITLGFTPQAKIFHLYRGLSIVSNLSTSQPLTLSTPHPLNPSTSHPLNLSTPQPK